MAEQSVLVEAYSSTSATIAEALEEARMRGVRVQILVDNGQKTERYSCAYFLANAGIASRSIETTLTWPAQRSSLDAR